MSGETPLTVVGNLTADPELKYTNTGSALAKFTIASTPRTYDRQTSQWKDGTPAFFRCTAWRQLAEHIAASLPKSTRVVASGHIRQHNWQTREGENRSMLTLEIDDIGPSLRFATAKVERVQRDGATSGPALDPWSPTAPTRTTVGDTQGSNEPPF